MTEAEHKPLIPVSQIPIGGTPVQAVDARELHGFLGVKKDFTSWIKAQITRARLVADRDFLALQREGLFTLKGEKSTMGRPVTEYWLTLDAAKHTSMMTGTEKGFAVREYFIECERRANGRTLPPSPETEIPWNERPIEDRRIELATIAMYLRTANPASAWWYARNYARVPIPPRRLQPAWWQLDADLGEPKENPAVDINVNLSGFANGHAVGNGSAH